MSEYSVFNADQSIKPGQLAQPESTDLSSNLADAMTMADFQPAFEDAYSLKPIPNWTEPTRETQVQSNTLTAIERFNNFLSRDFEKLDVDHNGRIDKRELNTISPNVTDRDELHLLAWMGKNMDALEKLGDKESGFSHRDLNGLNKVVSEGTDGLDIALRNFDPLTRAGASFAGGFATKFLAKAAGVGVSLKSTFGLSALVFGGLTALDVGGYYLFDKPKIDRALEELNKLPHA